MKCKLFILALIFSFHSFSQTNTSNERILNREVTVGIGHNYGLLGAKVFLNKNGKGLTLGLGHHQFAIFSIAAQYRYKFLFINLGYGFVNYKYERDKSGSKIYTGVLYGVNLLSGIHINLEKTKKLFIELAGGYKVGSRVMNYNNKYTNNAGVAFGFGLGFRIK